MSLISSLGWGRVSLENYDAGFSDDELEVATGALTSVQMQQLKEKINTSKLSDENKAYTLKEISRYGDYNDALEYVDEYIKYNTIQKRPAPSNSNESKSKINNAPESINTNIYYSGTSNVFIYNKTLVKEIKKVLELINNKTISSYEQIGAEFQKLYGGTA